MLLKHCDHLTLVFGDKFWHAHAWYDLEDEEGFEDANLAPHVYDVGIVDPWLSPVEPTQ
jgi:hypothetical protein